MMLQKRDMTIAESLASGKSITEVCQEVGISRQAVYQKLKRDHEFKTYYEELLGGAKTEALRLLRSNAHRACQVIVDMAAGSVKPNSARLQAACTLLDRIGITTKPEPEVLPPQKPLTQEEVNELLAEVRAQEQARDGEKYA